MSGNKFLLDTNAILYILSGEQALVDLLHQQQLYTSIISEIELLAFKGITIRERQQIKNFLSDFVIVNITDAIKEQAIETKKNSVLKLPDSVIAATAIVMDIPVVTSDKQFKTIGKLSILYYEK